MPLPHNSEDHRQLMEHYAAMMDGELEHLAAQGGELTEVARGALRAEIARRGLDAKVKVQVKTPGREWHRPVTLRVFTHLQEGLLAKSILESAGIRCFLADENIARLDGIMSIACGGLKLWVDEQDAAGAKELLEHEIPGDAAENAASGPSRLRCPHCQSPAVSIESLDGRAAPSGLFAKLQTLWKRRGLKCNSCGNEWRGS